MNQVKMLTFGRGGLIWCEMDKSNCSDRLPFVTAHVSLIGSLRNDDGHGNDNAKKQ